MIPRAARVSNDPMRCMRCIRRVLLDADVALLQGPFTPGWRATSRPWIRRRQRVSSGCGMCAHVCPRGVLKLEVKPDRFKGRTPIRVYAVDL